MGLSVPDMNSPEVDRLAQEAKKPMGARSRDRVRGLNTLDACAHRLRSEGFDAVMLPTSAAARRPTLTALRKRRCSFPWLLCSRDEELGKFAVQSAIRFGEGLAVTGTLEEPNRGPHRAPVAGTRGMSGSSKDKMSGVREALRDLHGPFRGCYWIVCAV